MASSSVPVVDILDDDDDDNGPAASPPSCKRSLGSSGIGVSSRDFLDAFSPSQPGHERRSLGSSGVSSRDFLDAFSRSPPRHKRPLPAAEGPINLDDTPSPPKRRRSSSSVSIDLDDTPSPPKPRPSSAAPELPVLVVDEDVPPSAPGAVVTDRTESGFAGAAFPESPETALPASVGLASVAVETPGFASPRSVRPPAAPGMSSAPPAQKGSGVTSLISLDSDDEPDDNIMDREPLTNLPSNTEAMMCQKDDDAQPVQAKQKRQPAGKKLTKEEKDKLMQEKKQKRQEDKLLKQGLKDELAKKNKMKKAIQKWESGKHALESITVQIDNSVIQRGSIGGPLLSSLTENGLSYEPTKNKITGSILWKLDVPDDIAQDLKDSCDMDQNASSQVKYVAIVLEAKEFCDLISSRSFFDHVQRVRDGYPGFTICYIINKLMNYVNKCEQSQYKNPSNTWRRPPVEEVLCKLATHYINVHSRQCIDEAEVVEHLVGLTSSLAKCKFRKPLTWLSVHANGAVIPKHFVHRDRVKNSTWFKALIAIPGIQSQQAFAIWKKYPSMRSLLNEYMDASKTVAEKERLLRDLRSEDRLGDEGRRLGDKCSKRVYIMLMAQNGDLDMDDPEAGG